MYYSKIGIFQLIWCILFVIHKYLKCTYTEYATLKGHGGLGWDYSALGQEKVAGCSENNNDFLGSVECGVLFD
jgi:hypothetical protein